MKIGIAGPISKESISKYVDCDVDSLPNGYSGAPLMGTLIGSLLKRGHSVCAYTTSSDLPPDTLVTAHGAQFKITFCPQRKRAYHFSDGHCGRAIDAFKLEREHLLRAMSGDAPDLVHAHWSYEFGMAAIASGLPNVITCHDAPQVVLKHIPTVYRLVRYFMAKQVLKQATHLTAVSPYLKARLEKYARTPIKIVPNPLPDLCATLTSHARQPNFERPRIAMILNGWSKLKNPEPALFAFAEIRRVIPSANLLLMGSDFGSGGKAENWARTSQLAEGVSFVGQLPYSLLLAELEKCDLLLHPSLEETFGMAVAEAMSLGIPVVGGEASGAVPWVVGNGGIVTDVQSSAAIVKAILTILADATTYHRFSTLARERVTNDFIAESVIKAYEAIYSEVLSESKRIN